MELQPTVSAEDREVTCWGENEAGTQIEPCSLIIKVAGEALKYLIFVYKADM